MSSRWRVPLSDVRGDDELVAAATEAIRSGWWSMGPRVESFEAQLAAASGVRNALAVANGTAALHLALLALEVGPADEVVTPALTFVAAANVIRHVGATPVFCDIAGEDDLNLDPLDVERVLTPRTKAIIAPHYAGFPCALDELCALADRHGVAVIEDAAHAIGATWRGRACGTVGALGCFSFFSNKNLPIGEGGAVVCDDPALAERVRLLRSHGMTSLTWDRHRGHAAGYDVVAVGFNYRLDEPRAAVASIQLGRLAAANRDRNRLADRYVELLDGAHGLTLPFARRPDRGEAAHHLAVALLPVGTDRDRVRGGLADRGIQTSVHYPPIHRFTAYADLPPAELPRTELVADRLLTLPLYPGLAGEDVELVASSLAEVLAEAEARSAADG